MKNLEKKAKEQEVGLNTKNSAGACVKGNKNGPKRRMCAPKHPRDDCCSDDDYDGGDVMAIASTRISRSSARRTKKTKFTSDK